MMNWHAIEEAEQEAKTKRKKNGWKRRQPAEKKNEERYKQYQHDYYLRVTKPKRQEASAAKRKFDADYKVAIAEALKKGGNSGEP